MAKYKKGDRVVVLGIDDMFHSMFHTTVMTVVGISGANDDLYLTRWETTDKEYQAYYYGYELQSLVATRKRKIESICLE
jgi:hypothetical protein